MSEQKMCLVPEAQHWHFALELLQSDFFPNAESPDKSLKEIVQNLWCAESSSPVHTEKGSYLWLAKTEVLKCWSHLKSYNVLHLHFKDWPESHRFHRGCLCMRSLVALSFCWLLCHGIRLNVNNPADPSRFFRARFCILHCVAHLRRSVFGMDPIHFDTG